MHNSSKKLKENYNQILGSAKRAEEILKEIENGAQGIIIAQGTDTIHYTSAALAFILENLAIPVLIVGAQRSSDRFNYPDQKCQCLY